GFWWTIGALVVSCILAHPRCISFINRSSLNQTYSARLSRAYLGASNPLRHSNVGRNIDEVMPEDDVESFRNYRPFDAGGPLHVLGICVNETLDQFTQREFRDRQGTSFAISPLGLSVGRNWHALWQAARHNEESDHAESESKHPIRAVGHTRGTPHPLLDINGHPPPRRRAGGLKQEGMEELPLRYWMSISGAAFGSGLGQSTTRALSLLFTMANMRTGYWWDSGLSSAERGARPQVSFVRRLIWLLPKFFVTQSRLIDEALARFPGPWWRYWYLSDGGHFENLGAYELIRRRVPFIVVVDAGADPDYDFDDFANLQRKVRIDFRTHLELFTEEDWDAARNEHIQQARAEGADDAMIATKLGEWNDYFQPIRAALARPGLNGGTFDELTPPSDTDGSVIGPSPKHAALFKVIYPNVTGQSLLLYLKASLTGDEPSDLRHYHLENQDFPHQSTADQFFDEAQWESYRRLGEHIGARLLTPGPVGKADSGNALWLTRLGLSRRSSGGITASRT
ncbi:MAG: hypothetical protein L0Z50_17605, partial [Verrucomicrobiales bacterium]|nr:hypothetical protein [Verrucomicrobiales bacterium]